MAVKVSGCIVNYRTYDKCRETIADVIKYTRGVDFTLYVVDNASGTGELAELKREFPSIRDVQSPWNGGFGAGNNLVIDELDSKYHVFINPDIGLDSDVITELAEYMEENPDVGIVTPKILNPDGTVQVLGKRNPTVLSLVGRRILKNKLKPEVEHYEMLDEDLSVPQDIQFATGCFTMIRTQVFRKIGGFDSDRFFMYYEDMDITRRTIEEAGMRAVYYPYAHVTHKWERASAHSAKYFMILVDGMFRYFNKWGWQFRYPELKGKKRKTDQKSENQA
ncbi:MAG: glycosyltransferase family 2 protein [Oscillospiraceae bacterium]|jgi:GT2 family glycosyltransferase